MQDITYSLLIAVVIVNNLEYLVINLLNNIYYDFHRIIGSYLLHSIAHLFNAYY